MCEGFAAALVECHGEEDRVHLLVEYPPKLPVSALVNSLGGVPTRRLRRRNRVGDPPRAPKVPAYFAASCRGASPSAIRHVEQQHIPAD